MKIAKTTVILAMAAVAIIGCKKESITQQPIERKYTGNWTNLAKAPAGPLDFFVIKLQLDSNYAGKSNFEYTSPYHTYPTTDLVWQKKPGDSVIITLNIPAYPDEIWELRGLANDASTEFTADYFSIPKTNPSGKWKYGTMVFKH